MCWSSGCCWPRYPPASRRNCALGARLQSDGFYYFAHLRSLWFDRRPGSRERLPAARPGRQDPPVRADGHRATRSRRGRLVQPGLGAVLRGRRSRSRDAARDGARRGGDGTSYPYRQAVCVAGLCWGLLGLLLHLPPARAVRRAGVGGVRDGRSWAAVVPAVVPGQGTVDDARAVDGGRGGLHVGVGGHARRADALAVGGARAARGTSWARFGGRT